MSVVGLQPCSRRVASQAEKRDTTLVKIEEEAIINRHRASNPASCCLLLLLLFSHWFAYSCPWSQDRLQSLWSWGIPPGGKHKQTEGGTRIYHSWRNSCLRRKHIKSEFGSWPTMCQGHTGTCVSLLAPEKNYNTACQPKKTIASVVYYT